MKFYAQVMQSDSTRMSYIFEKRREKKTFAYDRVNKPKARKVDKARNVGGTLAVIVTRQSRCRATTLDRSTGAFLSAERTIVRARPRTAATS